MKLSSLTLFFLLTSILFLSSNLEAQPISLYQKTFTAGLDEIGSFAGPANDGGLIVVGYTSSEDHDALAIKLDADGEVLWSFSYAAVGTQVFSVARQTSDGGFIVVGYNSATDEYLTRDVLLVKLKSDGSVDWAKTYGSANSDTGNDLVVATDGGFVIVGETNKTLSPGGGAMIMKTNSTGSISWFSQYGDDSGNDGKSISKTADGGYIVASTYGGDYINFLKLNSDGAITWSKSNIDGGFNGPTVSQVIQTSDGGYAAAAHIADAGLSDAAVIKLNSTGAVEWWKQIGVSAVPAIEDWAFGIQQYGDELILPGYTGNGGHNAFIMKLNLSGELLSSDIISSAERFGMYLSNGGDGGFAFASQKGDEILTVKLNGDLVTGCNYTDGELVILGETFIEGDAPTSFAVSTTPTPNNLTLSATPIVLNASTPCQDVPIVDFNINDTEMIYPNPGSDYIFISFNNIINNENVLVDIYNSNGQIILTSKYKNMKTISINTSDWQPGIYYAQFSGVNEFLRQKFILIK